MITHKSFIEHLNRGFSKAVLFCEAGDIKHAQKIFDLLVLEMEIHRKNTITQPPQLLRLERDIYQRAFKLARGK